MCSRLSAVMDLLGCSDARISAQLGYTNQTTLSQMRRGATFPDVEKLANLGQIVVAETATPNLHWVLTGVGLPFVPTASHASSVRPALVALNELAMMKYREARSARVSDRV